MLCVSFSLKIGGSLGMIRREEAMWRWFLGLSAVPGAMVLVAYRLLPESPRYLSVVGRHDGAVKVRGCVGVVVKRLLQVRAALTA